MEIIKAQFDDAKTWNLLATEQTAGVFQVESPGLTETLRRLNASKFEALSDVVALYRPGPLDAGMLDVYINRSTGKEPVTFDHPLLEPILKDTYGVILYQEQCLAAANQLAGYSLPEADLFRKAISSKKEDMLKKERSKFVDGCIKYNAIEKDIADKIFDNIVTFAGYAFNKSHSVCYALISYWTAYLKANYPIEYMTSLLGSQTSEDNIRKYIRASKDLGITVGPPDINESQTSFSIADSEPNTIVFGLSKIKGIGIEVAHQIIKNRPYKGFIDFIAKMDKISRAEKLSKTNDRNLQNHIDSRTIEILVKSGCFRIIEKEFTTKQILENIDTILTGFKNGKFISPSNWAKRHLGVWGMQKNKKNESLEYSLLELAHLERQTLGFYVTTHPMRHLVNSTILTNKKYANLGSLYDFGREFYTVGVLTDKVRAKKSRRGIVFYELEIEDEQHLEKFPIFGDTHQHILEELKTGDVVAVKMNKSKGRLYTEKIKKIETT